MKAALNKFKPITNIPQTKIDFLIERGGTVIKESEDKVIIKRMDKYATVDKFGRVTWTDTI